MSRLCVGGRDLLSLVDLPPNLRTRLIEALEQGVTADVPIALLQARLGPGGHAATILEALRDLERRGVVGSGAAAWLRAADHVAARAPRTGLVWSGPEVPGLHARDTRLVYQELLAGSQRSLWVSTYAYFDGPKAFEVLAHRMDAVPDLDVTRLLNIQRRKGDTIAPDQLVRRFAERFWGIDWPGTARPRVHYDPRSIELDGPGVAHFARSTGRYDGWSPSAKETAGSRD